MDDSWRSRDGWLAEGRRGCRGRPVPLYGPYLVAREVARSPAVAADSQEASGASVRGFGASSFPR
jgi:hypothetical protein